MISNLGRLPSFQGDAIPLDGRRTTRKILYYIHYVPGFRIPELKRHFKRDRLIMSQSYVPFH